MFTYFPKGLNLEIAFHGPLHFPIGATGPNGVITGRKCPKRGNQFEPFPYSLETESHDIPSFLSVRCNTRRVSKPVPQDNTGQ